jgi:(E)-4-hydroxy-3-methylbut-2-enyl-diphosphate synthase
MCTCPAAESERARAEIESLATAGCELVRIAVRDEEDIEALPGICRDSAIPVVADIHFDASLAVRAAATGVAGLRINPGNIGGRGKVEGVVDAAAGAGIPVRIGVNAGSIERELRGLYQTEPARALYESAANHLQMIERLGFRDLVFSLKSSDPMVTVEANTLFASDNDYPMHIGVTEAGPPLSGAARSVVALTLLLSSGIGDTVRISLSGDPVREVVAAGAMLSALGLRDDFPEIVSCPTCGRMRMDVAGIAERLEREILGMRTNLKVAIMGCEVNGPGEAREADIGIAGTREGAVLFKHGEVVGKLTGDFVEEFLREVRTLFGTKG